MITSINNERAKYSSLLLTLLFALLVMLPLSAAAQESPGTLQLVSSPLPINLVVEPGGEVSTQLRIQNGGTQSERIRVGLMKFSAHDDTGRPALEDFAPNDDAQNWVSFSEDEFTAGPQEWHTVTATFRPPEEAAFGYYYAVTFSRADNDVNLAERQTAVVGATATLVLVEVSVPNAERSGEVVSFSTDKRVYEFLPATFNVTLENTGNVHVAPRGNIFIDRGDESDVAILEVNEGQGHVLPESERTFTSQWTDGFPLRVEKVKNGEVVLDDEGNAETKLEWDFSQTDKLRWGRYTANLLLVYDDGQRDIPIEGTVSFWVVPWRVFGGVLIVVLLALFGLWGIVKSFMRRFRRS